MEVRDLILGDPRLPALDMIFRRLLHDALATWKPTGRYVCMYVCMYLLPLLMRTYIPDYANLVNSYSKLGYDSSQVISLVIAR